MTESFAFVSEKVWRLRINININIIDVVAQRINRFASDYIASNVFVSYVFRACVFSPLGVSIDMVGTGCRCCDCTSTFTCAHLLASTLENMFGLIPSRKINGNSSTLSMIFISVERQNRPVNWCVHYYDIFKMNKLEWNSVEANPQLRFYVEQIDKIN